MTSDAAVAAQAIHLDPFHDDTCAPVLAWQAHLDAGRLGANPPAPADVVAKRAATDALFRAIACDRARLAREGLA